MLPSNTPSGPAPPWPIAVAENALAELGAKISQRALHLDGDMSVVSTQFAAAQDELNRLTRLASQGRMRERGRPAIPGPMTGTAATPRPVTLLDPRYAGLVSVVARVECAARAKFAMRAIAAAVGPVETDAVLQALLPAPPNSPNLVNSARPPNHHRWPAARRLCARSTSSRALRSVASRRRKDSPLISMTSLTWVSKSISLCTHAALGNT